MPAAADQISYQDLYTRWEKSNWRAMEYDFTQDRKDWHETFSDLQRTAALWNYALFFHGEDSVADNLSPFIDAAPREEQKYFLATQQVDEARHAVLFKRFMHEVVGAGDGTIASGLDATRGELTYGFVKTFEHLDRVTAELRRDRSLTKLAQAVAMYHVIVEATLAQPGQHFIEAYLTEQDVLPAFRAGMRNVALDEQRHIGFGVKLLRDLATEDPEVPEAVADLLRDVLPHTVGVFAPPNWDRRYSECFGFTLEEIYEEGARSFESKMRAAGLPVEDLPGPLLYPIDLPPRERALRGMALLQAGILGEKNGPPARDTETMALLFDTVRRGVDFRTAPAGPLTVQWEFPDAEPWHLRLDNGSTAVTPGLLEAPDITFKARYEDFVDVVGGRLDPRRAMATGRLRPRGSLRTLWSARGSSSPSPSQRRAAGRGAPAARGLLLVEDAGRQLLEAPARLGQRALARRRQPQLVGAPVVGVALAPHELQRLELVDDRHDDRRRHPQRAGDVLLGARADVGDDGHRAEVAHLDPQRPQGAVRAAAHEQVGLGDEEAGAVDQRLGQRAAREQLAQELVEPRLLGGGEAGGQLRVEGVELGRRAGDGVEALGGGRSA